MKKRSVSLLDRAKGDLRTVKALLPVVTEEVDIDICAYHCQQCAEKAVKFIIGLEGKEYTRRHEMDMIIEDLDDPEALALAKSIMTRIDRWISSTRYKSTIASNRYQVEAVLAVCEKLVRLAEKRIPKRG
jgi:HEPN domain-containing protein